ncbi:hypothetical protein [Gemmata palustris]|uniref:hypothetical protein n=1 Tax=Gemmata palustris TaxID=2822762 RepID=UPI001FE3CED5|nr:hypothetical protein [Gemmata palustris]
MDVCHRCALRPLLWGSQHPGIIGGPKKAGTSFFHACATGVLIHKHRRYTVGLMSVTKGTKPHQQVQTLLDQVAAAGSRSAGVLDAGFDSGRPCCCCRNGT